MGLFSSLSIGDIVGGIGAVGGLISAFSGGPEVPKGVTQATKRAEQITAALMNPESAMFQRLANQEQGFIRRDYAQALRQLAAQNSRAVARTGGLGYMNPDRRDETLASIAKRGFVDAQGQSRTNARAYLEAALRANSGIPAMYAPVMQQQNDDFARRQGGYEALVDLGTSLGSRLLNGRSSQDVVLRFPQAAAAPSIYGR